jgi:PAS domain S-box-containing protein
MILSQKLANLWHTLELKFIPPAAWEKDLLTIWRERIIFSIFFLAAILGPFALIPSLILSFNEKLWAIFILDAVAYIIILVVLFSKKFSLKHKTWISFLIFYCLGSGILVLLGFYGAGYIWLFGASLIVGVMTGLKQAGIALLINFLSLAVIGVYIAMGSPQWALATENALEKWIVMIANFMMINVLVTLLVAATLNSLKIALAREQETAVKLRKKREELLAIFEASPDPILVYDNLDHVQYLNDAFTETFGWHLDEIKGQKISFIPKGQQKVSNSTRFKKRKTIKDTAIRFETKRFTKNGTLLDILLSAAPITENNGNTVGIVVNLKDITENKKLEVKVQQIQKMETIGTLAGGIAHDFNNILFPIVGYTEMLLEDIPKNSPFQSSIDKIHTSALRARDLVKQILAFSRQDTNELHPIMLQPIIKEVLKLMRSTIPTTIEIKQDISADCGKIKADSTQIHQILMNLTTNAFLAMEDTGGILNVRLKPIELSENDGITHHLAPGVYACLAITDTGMGISKDVISKIFDPFFTTREKGKGTGMGLSIVHGIVKSMGGSIQVYSEPGKGAKFNVYFPMETISFKTQKNPIKTSPKSGTERILLVDDEKAIIKMETRALERLGYTVVSYTSSMEALEVFQANPAVFDLVITDMAMPNLPGDKFSEELLKISPDLPIFICTGFSESMTEKKAAVLGIKKFLLKPIVIQDLSLKIREVLDKNKP